jgi:hypothetical protein
MVFIVAAQQCYDYSMLLENYNSFEQVQVMNSKVLDVAAQHVHEQVLNG